MSLIGIILLIGIVKKNGIMMVDFALAAERDEGLAPEAVDLSGVHLRFRPIMMTTMAALLGALPLAIGTGTGSEFRRPLGIAVRWRSAGFAVSDALCDAGDIPAFARLERRLCADGEWAARRRPSRRPPRRPRRRQARLHDRLEFLRPLHPAASCDGIVDARASAFWALSPTYTCRSPRCRRSSGRRSTSLHCCRAGARTRSNLSLTTPLERQLGLISGLTETHVSSIDGVSSITLEFGLDKDIDAAATSGAGRYRRRQPDVAQRHAGPPNFFKANPNGFPIIAIALTSDVVGLPDVYTFADTVLAQKLSQIEGVARSASAALRGPAFVIQVNPRAVADMHLSRLRERCPSLLKNASADLPKGRSLTDALGQLRSQPTISLRSRGLSGRGASRWRNVAPIKSAGRGRISRQHDQRMTNRRMVR